VTLLALVLAVPVIINRKSINYADVKDLGRPAIIG